MTSIRTSTQFMNIAMQNGNNDIGSILVVPEPPVRPIDHKKFSDFIKTDIASNATSHVVEQVFLKMGSELVLCFLKNNPSGTAISELEATAANFARVVAPDYFPPTFAVYDDNQDKYVGVASQAVPRFKTLRQDKVSPDDLDTRFLEEKKISIPTMEKLDAELQVLENQIESLEKCIYKLKAKEVEVDDFIVIDENKTEIMQFQAQLKQIQKQAASKIAELKLTPKEVKRYRNVKGLAIGFTTSYIFLEDDLHPNNISKDGKRVDCDMMLYPFLYYFKDKNYFEQWTGLRQPNESTTIVSVYDIVNFPDVKDWQPHYGPTLPPSQMAPPAALKTAFNFAANDYTASENEYFKKLKNNPVFVHHKNATFTRYLLTTPDIYQQVGSRHLHEEYVYEGKPLLEQLVVQQGSRIEEFRKALILIENFASFFEKNHHDIGKKLLEDLHKEKITYVPQTAPVKDLDEEKIKERSKKLLRDIECRRKAAAAKAKFDDVKENVIKAMDDYCSPGFLRLGGLLYNHKNLALGLKNFCSQQQPEPNDDISNMVGIRAIQAYINDHFTMVQERDPLLEVLANLQKMINKQLEGVVTAVSKPVKAPQGFVLV